MYIIKNLVMLGKMIAKAIIPDFLITENSVELTTEAGDPFTTEL